jgi:hypothetical protein
MVSPSGWLGHFTAQWAQSRSSPWQKLVADAHAHILAKTEPNIGLEPTPSSLRSASASGRG